MRITFSFLFSFLLFILYSNYVLSQGNYRIYNRAETIKVISADSGYISHVDFTGRTTEIGGKAYVHFNLLEKVDDLNVGYFKKNGKIKNIRKLQKEDLSITSGFYSDSRVYLFNLPEDKHFIYDYNKQCDELFYLSSLKFGVYDADTQVFVVQIPHDMNMHYEVLDTASLQFYDEKVTDYKDYTEYIFIGVIDTVKPNKKYKKRFISINNDAFPSIRLIVTPDEYNGRETEYFNNWMIDLVLPSEKMGVKTIDIIEDLVGEITNKDSIIEVLFDFVKTKIRYVDIEIGIGGYRPHEVDYILERKQGDCKDMANLLCQALRHFEIDANLAISSTINHWLNMDFPSLSSGNHQICVVKRSDGSHIFLDATETEGYYLNPSRQIQGTSVFVFGEGKGYFMDVPIVKADENTQMLKLDLSLSNKKLIGTYQLEFNSISALRIKSWYNQKSAQKFITLIKSYLNELSPRINYLSFNVVNENNKIVINGIAEVPKSGYTSVGENKYLLLSFMPFPSTFFNELEKNTSYITYSTINSNVELNLDVSSTIKEVGNVNIDMIDGPLSFSFDATAQDSILMVRYQYKYDNIIIEEYDSERFIAMDKKIKSRFNKAIVFK